MPAGYFSDIEFLVTQIPAGTVLTYGDIAKRVGCHARQVSYVLRHTQIELPWHRVINHAGKISLPAPKADIQKQKLLAEGVFFSKHAKIDLNQYRWHIPEFLFSSRHV